MAQWLGSLPHTDAYATIFFDRKINGVELETLDTGALAEFGLSKLAQQRLTAAIDGLSCDADADGHSGKDPSVVTNNYGDSKTSDGALEVGVVLSTEEVEEFKDALYCDIYNDSLGYISFLWCI